MNKKGIYAPVLVIFTLFLLSYAVISVVGKDSVYLELAGKNQIKLINKYQEGEFSKQYIKQSARNSINNVLYEFGQNGAIKDPKCKKNDYFVWDKDCKPNKEDFIFYFEKNFKKFLNLQKTPNLNFKYTLTKNNLIAKSENSLLFNLDKEGINTKKQNLLDFRVRETGFDHHILEASKNYDLDPNLIKAIIKVESSETPDVESEDGAKGLMQVREIAYKEVRNKLSVGWTYKEAEFDPRLNILTGTAYFKLQLNEFKDLDLALAAYNAGPARVREYNGIPPFKETKDYIKRVKENYNKLKASTKSQITGAATLNPKTEAILTGTYELDPSFIELINFNFSILDELYKEVINSKDCLNKADLTTNLNGCVKDKKDFEWKLNKEGNFINFQIITKSKILRNENKRLTQDNLVIRFKVDLKNI